MKKFILPLAVCAAFALTGCATNVSEFKIDDQALTTTQTEQIQNQSIFIRNIVDARTFDPATRDPSVPSVICASETEKDHAIGRKRNGYGKALGSLVLTPEQTVRGLTREALENALLENGWNVIHDEKNVTPNTVIVDVTITKWWAWMNPGFWQLTLSSNMAATVQSTRKGDQPINVASHYEEGFQMATETNWLTVLQHAFDRFVMDSKAQMSKLKK